MIIEQKIHGHFLAFDLMVKTLSKELSEELIKNFQWELKSGVYNERINGWIIGEYRSSDIDITSQMKELLRWYHAGEKTLHTLAEFYVCYKHIQPFQSGNGRVGRLILFRECLRNGIKPLIIEAENRDKYINSLELAQKGDLEPLEKFFEKEQEVYQKDVDYFI